MRPLRSVGVGILTAAVTGACGEDSGNGPAPGGQISGRERIAWDQPAASAQELSALRHILWIDESPDYMSGVTCDALRSGVAACSGPLRAMSPGAHQLALSAVGPDGTSSTRSPALSVTVMAQVGRIAFDGDPLMSSSSTTGSANASHSTEVATTAGPVRVETIAEGLREATDLAATPDGRVFVAERQGVLRVWSEAVGSATPVLTLDDVSTLDGSGLLSVTIAPDYEHSRHVYLGYTASTGFRIARYRDAAGSLAERAIVFEATPDVPYTAAVVRFGPDGRLYVALDDEGDPRHGGDLGSFSGKVLRLNPDGSAPDDQPAHSPVHVTDVRRPRGLAWSADVDRLWIANGEDVDGGTLDVARRDGGVPERGARRAIAARFAVPGGDTPTAALLYRGEAFKPWDGDLLVALFRSGQVLRLDLDAANPDAVAGTEIILDGSEGPIRAMAMAADGVLYVASERGLLRLMPRRDGPRQ